MSLYTKIRAALEQADALIPDFSYLRTKQDEALAALAELENSDAPKFEAAEVDDVIALNVVRAFDELDEEGGSYGRNMIAAVRAELGPTLGMVAPDVSADARIAELERDAERTDAQWRDKLRIYRESEDARIAELEADAARYRWLVSDPIQLDEGKLWSLIRNVMQQGADIQLDHRSLGYEKYSARLDAAAADRVTDFTKLIFPRGAL